jgi:hypothetical protein
MIELHVSSEDLSINHQVKEAKVCVNPHAGNIGVIIFAGGSSKGDENFENRKNLLEDGEIKGCAINHTSLNSPLGLIYMCLGKV